MTAKSVVLNYFDPSQLPPHSPPEAKQTALEDLHVGSHANTCVRKPEPRQETQKISKGTAAQLKNWIQRESLDFTMVDIKQSVEATRRQTPPDKGGGIWAAS